MASRSEIPAPECIVGLKGGRGQEGEPIEWTGWACCEKREIEANPGFLCVTAAPSTRKGAEVIEPYAA
jgi:hypothetical protein